MGMIPAGQKVAVYCATDTNAVFAVQTLRVYKGREASSFRAELLPGRRLECL